MAHWTGSTSPDRLRSHVPALPRGAVAPGDNFRMADHMAALLRIDFVAMCLHSPAVQLRRAITSGWPITRVPSVNAVPFDRHRGGGQPPTPATPPCVRVRTRRFETVTLTVLAQ